MKFKIRHLLLLTVFGSCQPTQPQRQIPIKKIETVSVPSIEEKVITKHKNLMDVAFVTGKFEPKEHPEFVLIDVKYADRAGLYAHKECYQAFIKMQDAAKKEGLTITIRSAARNFNYQRNIWESKWNGTRLLSGGINAQKQIPNPVERAKEIMKYSAMPGASRHHWGTDLDFNAFDNSYFESGGGLRLFEWLENNASSFGFARPYTTKGPERPYGYNEEKWHWSYLPVSKELTAFTSEVLENKDISGFDGDEVAEQLQVKEHYILGLSKECF